MNTTNTGSVQQSYNQGVLWFSLCCRALEAASQLGGEDLEPFYALLEGGRYGDFYAEMEDYFYYAQIKR